MDETLDKVIEGLINCREMDNSPGYRIGGCHACPYGVEGSNCVKMLKDDAIAKLKLLKEMRHENGTDPRRENAE